jgi:four helix bundle protein
MKKEDKQNLKPVFIKRAFELSLRVIKMTETLPKLRSYWVITDQLIRSVTSIGANMTEAKSASSKKDYINFYNHALKSANEAIYWLTLLGELQQNHSSEIGLLIKETTELANILAASIITMKRNL